MRLEFAVLVPVGTIIPTPSFDWFPGFYPFVIPQPCLALRTAAGFRNLTSARYTEAMNKEMTPNQDSDQDSSPQVQDSACAPEWAIPTGAPEEFGFHRQSASHEKARCWDRQELFLAAYRECGRIAKAAEAVGLTRWAVGKWNQNDVFGFRDRVKAAHADWCENVLEARIDNRLDHPEGNRGSDILAIFQLKAENPSKYREEPVVVDMSASKELLDRLRAMGQPRVVEGSVVPGEPAQEPESSE